MTRVIINSRSTWAHAHQAPSSPNILIRRAGAVPLALLLLAAAMPFAPASWVFPSDAASLVDTFISSPVILGAVYFQWQTAAIRFPYLFGPLQTGAPTPAIRNGQIQMLESTVWVWQPANYWPCLVCEALLLYVAHWGGNEVARRIIVSMVMGGLWVVGLPATPEWVKVWAWDQIKRAWFWMAFDEVLRMGRYGGRRRRGRWY
jgi:hypothetical protein